MESDMLSKEMDNLSFKIQQHMERKKMLSMIQEYKTRFKSGNPGDGAINQAEISRIDEQIKQLSEQKLKIQERLDNTRAENGNHITPKSEDIPSVVFVDAPPPIIAPRVILDIDQLPTDPSKTQCPHCRQYITTETEFSVGNLSWLVCCALSSIGCIAGCCLFGLCLNKFKDVTHKCPKCRGKVHKIKRSL